ncbi:MAG TPA: excinuclease ABC subunit UvrC [Acholeplasmataceae bacterium]|nr:excinuclease ABC subunit UvrC [Acholeplasmataceae bacterium]
MELKEKLANLPKKPGCYQMLDENREIIYVGKAKNLYNRVRSYFTGSHDAKTTKMISNIHDIEYIVTSTETEAFILEMNLIKKHRPKYNIMLMDDKRYPYICITDEDYPRVYYTRDLSEKGRYYGPYPDAFAAREVVDLINRIYPLRKCRVLPKKECLYYHIGQCLAPCIIPIDPQKFREMTDEINNFLKGNIKEQRRKLETLMYEASENLNFEKAIEYRQLIEDFEKVSEKQKMEFQAADVDVFGYVQDKDYISIQVFHIRSGKTVERSGFLFEIMGKPEEMFIDFLAQFYLIKNNPIPKEIIIPDVDISMLAEELAYKITIPKRGQKKEFVQLVTENAKEKMKQLLIKEEMKYERTLGAVIELGKLLEINTPHVIEAFDNSNIQGTSSVSAMVSFVEGVPMRKNYRKYKIKYQGANDYESMIEVITRRYRRLKQENKAFPDLVVVDGGAPQVLAAEKALKALELEIPVLGLSKDNKHRTSYLYFKGEEIHIDKRSNLFFFLENLQDEVHRFAITFHHLVRSKNTLQSKLENIKGIGKVKRNLILTLLKESNQDNFKDKLKEHKFTDEQINEIIKTVQ